MSGGPYYIHEDGVQVLTWTCSRGGFGTIVLDDGRALLEAEYIDTGRVWATHPSINPNVTMVDGVWHYEGKSLREPGMGPLGGGEE